MDNILVHKYWRAPDHARPDYRKSIGHAPPPLLDFHVNEWLTWLRGPRSRMRTDNNYQIKTLKRLPSPSSSSGHCSLIADHWPLLTAHYPLSTGYPTPSCCSSSSSSWFLSTIVFVCLAVICKFYLSQSVWGSLSCVKSFLCVAAFCLGSLARPALGEKSLFESSHNVIQK